MHTLALPLFGKPISLHAYIKETIVFLHLLQNRKWPKENMKHKDICPIFQFRLNILNWR